MVETRGQTGSEGSVTSTPNTTAPVRPTAAMAPATKAGLPGRGKLL